MNHMCLRHDKIGKMADNCVSHKGYHQSQTNSVGKETWRNQQNTGNQQKRPVRQQLRRTFTLIDRVHAALKATQCLDALDALKVRSSQSGEDNDRQSGPQTQKSA